MRRGSIQKGKRGRDSKNQPRRNRGGHRSSQTIKHRTTRCRADRAAPANSVGIGEDAGGKEYFDQEAQRDGLRTANLEEERGRSGHLGEEGRVGAGRGGGGRVGE